MEPEQYRPGKHTGCEQAPSTSEVFLGSWMLTSTRRVSQRSAPQRRHMAHLKQRSHCAPRKLSSWDGGGDKTHRPTWGVCTRQAPGLLSCSDLGRAYNAGPTESVPLWSTSEPEPEWLRPAHNPGPTLDSSPAEQPGA